MTDIRNGFDRLASRIRSAEALLGNCLTRDRKGVEIELSTLRWAYETIRTDYLELAQLRREKQANAVVDR